MSPSLLCVWSLSFPFLCLNTGACGVAVGYPLDTVKVSVLMLMCFIEVEKNHTSQTFGHTYSFKGFSLFVLFSTL